jgi:small subunit ribosomal protein S3
MQNAMRLGAQGIKLMSSGRPERHRNRALRVVSRRSRAAAHAEGRHRLRLLEAKTTYGIIGVKCWVYRGDRLANGEVAGIVTPPGAEDDPSSASARRGSGRWPWPSGWRWWSIAATGWPARRRPARRGCDAPRRRRARRREAVPRSARKPAQRVRKPPRPSAKGE